MSDDRLDELGLPRREFLKRLAVGAFVVPSVVSFVLDAVAEGATQFVPNQCFPNQPTVLVQLSSALYYARSYGDAHVYSRATERHLLSTLLHAQVSVQNEDYIVAYTRLVQLEGQIQQSKWGGSVPLLLNAVQHALNSLNC